MTATACGSSLLFTLGSPAGMFSWLLRLCQKENGDEGETRPTEKEEGILSHEKGRRKWLWRMHSESWAELGNFLVEVGLSWAVQE